MLSLKVALLATILVACLGVPTAWVFATRSFRGKSLAQALILLPLVLPPTVTGFFLVILFGRHGWVGSLLDGIFGWTPMFSWWGALLASLVVSFPLMVRATQPAFESIDRRLVETSWTLGYSAWETFWRIEIPLAWRGIVAGLALSFARAIGEFGATLMIAGNIPGRTDTMPLAIYGKVASGLWSEAYGLVALLTCVSILSIVLAERWGRRLF
jgi:molybdate transport system permease protein